MALSDAEKFEWLNNDNHRIVLMDVEYHNGTTLETARFASYPYIQPIGDVWNTFSNLIYDDIISTVPNIVTRIDSDSTVGQIELLNTDGEYDWLLQDVTIVGHSLQLSIGEKDWIRDDFIIILDGIVNSVSSSSPETIQISLRDRKETLNVKLQENLYTQGYTNAEWAALTPAEKAATNEHWHKLMDAVDASLTVGSGNIQYTRTYDRSLAVLPDEIKNTHIPIALGKCFNIEPVLVDSWNHIYHIHSSGDAAIDSLVAVTEVRSNGVPLTPTNGPAIYRMQVVNYIPNSSDGFLLYEFIEDLDDPNTVGIVVGYTGTEGSNYTLYYANLGTTPFSATTGRFEGLTSGVRADAVTPVLISAGQPQYEVDLNLGVIRLLVHPNGTQITCDIVAQESRSSIVPPANLVPPYVLTPYSAAWIIEWILLEKAGLPFTDLCQLTFPPAGSKGFPNDSEMGIYYKTETTILDVVTKIISSVGGFIRFKDDACKMQLYLLIDPLGETPDLTLIDDDIVENGISIASIEEPKKAITFGYKKNWKPQDEGSLAQSLTDITSPYYNMNKLDSFKNDYTELYSLASPELDPLEYPLADEVDLIESTLWNTGDAQAELDRRVTLRSQRRRIIRIHSLATSFTYDVGDIVHITHPRFGLYTGKEAIIIGVEESPTSKRVTLDVWL